MSLRLSDEKQGPCSPPNAPVDRLPNELMLVIFCLALGGRARHASRLMLVSRRWYELALGCHDLWTDIIFDPLNLQFIRNCLERSGNELLTITVNERVSSNMSRAEKQRRFETFVRLLLSHNHHWGMLYIEYDTVRGARTKPSSPSFQELPYSLVEKFRSDSLKDIILLTNHERAYLTDPFYDYPFWHLLLADSVRRFPRLQLIDMNDFIPAFSPTLNPAIPHLTRLDLEFHFMEPGEEFHQLVNFLGNFPGLQHLSINLYNAGSNLETHFNSPESLTVFPELASLSLVIQDTGGAYVVDFCRILNFCHFPSLKNMFLTFEDVEIVTSHWTVDLFTTNNEFPSLQNLELRLHLITGNFDVQSIEIPIETIASLKTLGLSLSSDGLPFEILLGKGPKTRFPALQSLEVDANWEEGTGSPMFVKKWIAAVVKRLKARKTWETFEHLSVSLKRSEIGASELSFENLSANLSDPEEQNSIDVALSRNEAEDWLEAVLN